jgi:hypothetical protein
MAWTWITYKCGHEERIQLYGPGRARDARIASYAQRLCRACYFEEHEAQPRYHIRSGGSNSAGRPLVEFIVLDGYELWPALRSHGYSLAEVVLDAMRELQAMTDAIEPGRGATRKAWCRLIPSGDEAMAETRWLDEQGIDFAGALGGHPLEPVYRALIEGRPPQGTIPE